MKIVDFFWSHQSPYCYFTLDRLIKLNKYDGVEVRLNVVLPGVLRIADTFADRGQLEIDYFNHDVRRTAEFLGLDFGEANPYPVEFKTGSKWVAAAEQPRIDKLNYLTQAANELGQGWAFLDQVARLIWDGKTKNWHLDNHFQLAVERTGIEYPQLVEHMKNNKHTYDAIFAANQEKMFSAGHWGVPCYVYKNEAFYGQDRFDQLIWRLGINWSQGRDNSN